MNIAYLYEKEIQNALAINTSVLAYDNNVLNYFNFFAQKTSIKTCKIQSILVKYSEIMKLQASLSSTFNFLESIYNINNNLILRKRPTDPFILDCKLLLRLKKKIRSLKLHPKPK